MAECAQPGRTAVLEGLHFYCSLCVSRTLDNRRDEYMYTFLVEVRKLYSVQIKIIAKIFQIGFNGPSDVDTGVVHCFGRNRISFVSLFCSTDLITGPDRQLGTLKIFVAPKNWIHRYWSRPKPVI